MNNDLIISNREISQIALNILNSDELWDELVSLTNFTLHNWIDASNTDINTRFTIIGCHYKPCVTDAQVWFQPYVDHNDYLMIRICTTGAEGDHYSYIYSDGSCPTIADVDARAIDYHDFIDGEIAA